MWPHARQVRGPGLHPTDPCLDASFAALSDATRRGVLEQLGRGDTSLTDLADRFQLTLTGMKKHVGVLEQAGLVMTAKVGACGRARSASAGRMDVRSTVVRCVMLHPSQEALDAAGTGGADATVETFAQLDKLLLTL